MFNKGLFNRLLFNRVVSLFKNRTEIDLLGSLVGFFRLEGLFQPELSLHGIQNLTAEQFGLLSYSKNLLGHYKIYYGLEGEQILILEGEGAKAAIDLLGEWQEEITPRMIEDKNKC